MNNGFIKRRLHFHTGVFLLLNSVPNRSDLMSGGLILRGFNAGYTVLRLVTWGLSIKSQSFCFTLQAYALSAVYICLVWMIQGA